MEQHGDRSLRHCIRPLSQYREPLCLELSGVHIRLDLDTGEHYSVTFTSDTTATWYGPNDSVCQNTYACVKLKPNLYLINIRSHLCQSMVGIVLDLESGFVAVQRQDSQTLARGIAITLEKRIDTTSRHTGKNLVGHSILWRCAAQTLFTQTFTSPDAFMLTCMQPTGDMQSLPYTSTDDCIREDIYLISATTPNRKESLLLLVDLNAVRMVGLSSLAGQEADGAPQDTLFSAYGTFILPGTQTQAALTENDIQKYKKRILGRKVYNPITQQPIPGGLKQYVYPTTTELAGKVLDMRLDGKAPVLIHFLDATTLTWAEQGKPFRQEKYECIKADDAVYLIVLHPQNREPASCVSLVWDRDTRLITAVFAWDKLDARNPRLVTSHACFGVESVAGEALPTLRHQYTQDLLGKRFVWHYTANDDVLHICFSQTHFRLGRASIALTADPSPEALAHYERLMQRKAKYPYYEENVYYIRLREGLYLYSVIEYAMCRLLPQQGGGELLALVNTKRERYIGRSFGLDAQENTGHDIIGAPGSAFPIPDEVESLPCPIYDV